MQELLDRATDLLLTQELPRITSEVGGLSGIVALGYAHLHWTRGTELFRQLFLQQDENGLLSQGDDISHFPIYGFLLAGFYELAPDEKSARAFLLEMYPKVLAFHRYLYQERDPTEEGLVVITHSKENLLSDSAHSVSLSLQDPIFNALLVWSNECLIDIGSCLGKDVLEIMQWNELAIYSLNDKLWDEDQSLYRAFDLETGQWAPADPHYGMLPLIGEVPDQDQAELMLETWKNKRFPPQTEQSEMPYGPSILADWLLYHGLWRFDMTAAANSIRRQNLDLMATHGFAATLNGTAENPVKEDTGCPLTAAALCIDWIKT